MTTPSLLRHLVPSTLLQDTRDFLYAKGLEGCEGMALWIGVPGPDEVHLTRLLIPEQVCIKTPFGIAVEMTEQAHLTLTDHLQGEERFFVRVHSHPGAAYHSARDDANLVLTHQGALSVVVPNFASAPLDLAGCAIYQLRYGSGWVALSAAEVTALFQVTP